MSVAYLYGHPVAHSLSPAMHNAAFAKLGMRHRYEALDVPPAEVEAAVDRLRGESVLGANVTVPHKLAVMPFLDRIAADAEPIGAVNTIVRSSAALVG
ncbi:MAG: shikimate dehydrogenase, partial [Chloroflexi bacterium]|nr:shikimate dehydrogenase [Chloroflexota bacterium]